MGDAEIDHRVELSGRKQHFLSNRSRWKEKQMFDVATQICSNISKSRMNSS